MEVLSAAVLFLQQYTTDLIVTDISIEGALPVALR